MAYDFDGVDDFFKSSLALSGEPVSVSCWFNPGTSSNDGFLMVMENSGGANNFQFYLGGDNRLRAISRDSASAENEAVSTNTTVAGTWSHGAAIWAATNDRRVFLDNTKVTNGTLRPVGATDRIAIADQFSGGVPFDGMIAEVAVWNIALTDDEVAILNQGFNPQFVRPSALRFYAPLVRELVELRQGAAFTTNGVPVVADHPRVILPLGIGVAKILSAVVPPVEQLALIQPHVQIIRDQRMIAY